MLSLCVRVGRAADVASVCRVAATAAAATAPARRYHERVVDHYERPRNVGSLDKTSDDVGTGLVRALCVPRGDFVAPRAHR